MDRLYGRSSAELREMALRWWFLPACRELFARDLRWQSVVIAVAQYWNDEANDSVHVAGVPLEMLYTDWAALAAFLDEEADQRWEQASARSDAWEAALDAVRAGGASYMDNGDYIPAFGRYCAEGANQESSWAQAWRAYAVVRRASPDVTVEIVGNVLQPAWEDHFVVGYRGGHDDPEDALEDGPFAGASRSAVADAARTASLRRTLRPLLQRALVVGRAATAGTPSVDPTLSAEVLAFLRRCG